MPRLKSMQIVNTNVDFVEVSKTTRGIAKTINEDAPLQNVEDLQSTTNYFKHNPKSQNIIITYKDFNINISNDTDLVRLSNVLKVVTGIDV